MKRRKRLKRFSYSSWSRTQDCPARTAYAKIDELPDPSGPGAIRGKAIHKGFEDYANEELAELPTGFGRWQPALDKIFEDSQDYTPEMEIALTRGWKKTSWKKGKIVGVIDLVYILNDDTIGVVDYKTGRPYPDHEQQLEWYATLLFHRYEWAQRILAADWYLDSEDAEVARATYTRDAYEEVLLPFWQKEAEALLSRNSWPATRNRFCRWCAFSSKKGGPCIEG